jgi:pyruvate dehydrogenase E2 component (dihydrolipoamide acetyltransferase)
MTRWTRMPESSWRRISLSAWSRPRDPSVYGWLDLDVSRALEYLAQLEHEGQGAARAKVTLTHLVGKAVALAVADCPEVNGIVRRGHHVYQRDSVDVFFQVAYQHGRNLTGAKVEHADRKSLPEIAAELAERAAAIRSGGEHSLRRSDATLSRVPAPLRGFVLRAVETAVYELGLDLEAFGVPRDAFGSAMVTNVGMFGLPHGFAPLVPFSRTPIVVTVGALRDAPVAEAGAVAIRPLLPVGVTFDHRILDGHQAGRLAGRFREVMCDPAAALG